MLIQKTTCSSVQPPSTRSTPAPHPNHRSGLTLPGAMSTSSMGLMCTECESSPGSASLSCRHVGCFMECVCVGAHPCAPLCVQGRACLCKGKGLQAAWQH